MSDRTLLLVAGGGLALWYLFVRKPVAAAAPAVNPYAYPYGPVAGYQPVSGTTTDPGDVNSWAPMVTALAGLGTSITNAVIQSSGPSTSSGSYSGSDPYATSVADGGWADVNWA